MQDEVVGVSASGAVVASHDLTDVQPIDVGLATLEFRSGGLGSLQIYRNAVYGYDVRTEVLGTDGAVMIGDTPGRVTGSCTVGAQLSSSLHIGSIVLPTPIVWRWPIGSSEP